IRQLGAGPVLLVDLAVEVIEHEPDVPIDVPVEAGSDDLLATARDAVREPEPVVEIHSAVACSDFPGAPGAVLPRPRIVRNDPVVGRGGAVVRTRLAGNDPADLRITALEFEVRPGYSGGCGRDGKPLDVIPEVFALEEHRTDAACAFDVVNARAR